MRQLPLRVACVGEAMVEITGLDLLRGRAKAGVAGDALNTAIYLKRALPDAEVSFVTALGPDTLSADMLRAMEAEGLSTSLVARLPDRAPGLYAVNVDATGERSFTYWRNESAARAMLGPAGVDLSALEDVDALYVSGITLAILPPVHRHSLLALAARLKARGRMVAFDSNYRPRLWDGVEAARRAYDAAWTVTTLALPSRDDEARLYPGESPDDLFARLAALGVLEVALKDGAAGPHLWAGRLLLPGRYDLAPQIVDTTAAGDGFNAGYLAARLKGESPQDAAQAGHGLACAIIQHAGAIIPRQ